MRGIALLLLIAATAVAAAPPRLRNFASQKDAKDAATSMAKLVRGPGRVPSHRRRRKS